MEYVLCADAIPLHEIYPDQTSTPKWMRHHYHHHHAGHQLVWPSWPQYIYFLHIWGETADPTVHLVLKRMIFFQNDMTHPKPAANSHAYVSDVASE